jgi:hypothetical protein
MGQTLRRALRLVDLFDRNPGMLAPSDDWWSALPWAARLHMNRLMFRPLGRVAHIGMYFIAWVMVVVANDDDPEPPPVA